MMRRLVVGLVALALVGALNACSEQGAPESGGSEVTGVVTAIDGDLSEVRAFSIRLSDGSAMDLVPEAGLLFDGGPLIHLRDHMVSGAPVTIQFYEEGGVAIATGAGDAE